MAKLTPELRAKIDGMTYQALLSRWRFDPIGSDFFQGESGEYASSRMRELTRETPSGERVAASKRIGW